MNTKMKIAFTSCTNFKHYPNQPWWAKIEDQDPDYLFLLGDNIYMDYGIWNSEANGKPRNYPDDKFRRVMNEKYQKQFSEVHFKRLVKKMRAKNALHAIWDDHDFAWNDVLGCEVNDVKAKATRELFHKYFQCSANYPETYYAIETPLAKVIFLDVRSESTTTRQISPEQFEFIAKELEHELPYTIICSGLTLNSGIENWKKKSSDYQKLCKILSVKNNVLFLAGDIHQNKYVKPKPIDNSDCMTPFQLISSGLAVNLLGLASWIDGRHNYAILDLEETKAKIEFYNKRGYQRKKSHKANKALEDYLIKP